MLCHCDQLRILNATGQRLALPTVEGLALVTFVHDILNQVARAGRHHLGASVGTTEGGGEDFDCLCFVHGPILAQIRDFCCINGYRLANPVGELSHRQGSVRDRNGFRFLIIEGVHIYANPLIITTNFSEHIVKLFTTFFLSI